MLALQWRGEGGARRRPFLAATDASSSRRAGKGRRKGREGGRERRRKGGKEARWGRGKERKNTSRMPCVRVCKGAVRGFKIVFGASNSKHRKGTGGKE